MIRKFLSNDPEELCISAITYAELMHGVEKSIAVERNRIAMSLFLSPIIILQFLTRAIEAAIDDCIRHHILEEFFRERRAEVVKVTQLDYTWERREKLIRAEEYA